MVFRDADDLRVFKVGQVHVLRLDVMVENLGEDAHETTLTVDLPEKVRYIGVETNPSQVCSRAAHICVLLISNTAIWLAESYWWVGLDIPDICV